MKRSEWLSAILSVFVLLTAVGCEARYSNPSPTVQGSALAGTWEARYMEWGVDRLILRTDGTFKQIYQDYTVEGYAYETPWNEWWVERFPDGRMRLHLQGARIYKEGIRIAERDGMHDPGPADQPNFWGESGPPPFAFYDPIAEESVEMVGELVLNVQSDSSGEIVLLHMLLSSDQGFVSLTGKAIGFNCIETEPSLQTPSAP